MEVNGETIELDNEGYLIEPSQWDRDVAIELAKTENLELNDEHWIVFDLMRDFYNENGVAPDVRHIFKQLGVDLGISKKEAKAKLFSLFPYGYVQQACKISGMRRPRGWSTG
ncbi:tRNA 2-thiouridine synthesizing protein E @ Dissimilatory sulfite reductase, gamma subunit [hydrothermal vent metagenome]|jgi:tRNA 2-thiouridine synthesizing protein E|uniref:tRNA 2-thiouridine synthesizing protein E @ Dissimilatory sulfite reductase, gamma subunit n=1 Tax=hydrothermal vent metagenome TaxID=652676 RepID=A0A1W1DR69_9ZZZZ